MHEPDKRRVAHETTTSSGEVAIIAKKSRIQGPTVVNESDPPQQSDLAAELVDDKELRTRKDDRFRHLDLVDLLADLVSSIDAPANVALYGPWGSGKSSIGYLLQEELGRRHSDDRFVRYDAFKYAQLPLQRHFIASIAKELAIKDRKFGKGLYEETTSSDISLAEVDESSAIKRTLRLFGLVALILGAALAVAMLLTAVASGVGSWLSSKSFGDVYVDYLQNHTIGFLAPAGLLSVFVVFASRTLTVGRSQSAPTSEEQFAQRFRDLVAAATERHRRLVIFIDELDRCDTSTVVATLDSLRTFLDAPDCVFIVAADQQVLEQALTERATQATPVDSGNPYYSAGSEYLDKTFHYQVAIPALLPRRLSGFAVDLVREKPGVWAEVSVERVVSVLIPNHVRSPRRAKALLNSFALLYSIASERTRAGHLGGDVVARAEELAVLTALRGEFPLFARELRRHHRLPEAVRLLADDPRHQLPTDMRPETWNVAQGFAKAKRPTDVLLPHDPDAADSPDVPDHDGLIASQTEQLKAYLRKTAYVRGPGRDLIHMESAGARFGLDPDIAEELEDAASQGDVAATREALDRLGDDRLNGLLALAQSLDRDVPPLGHEAENLVTVLLRLYADEQARVPATPDLGRLAARFADAVNGHLRAYELRQPDLPGALALALDSATTAGASLIDAVLNHDQAEGDPDLIRTVISRADSLSPSESDSVGRLCAAAILAPDAVESVHEALMRADPLSARRVLELAEPHLGRMLKEVDTGFEPEEELEEDELQEARAANTNSAASTALDVFSRSDREDLAHRVAAGVLAANVLGARNAVRNYLPDLGADGQRRTGYAGLSSQLLTTAQRRSASEIARWLRLVEPSHIAPDARSRAIDALTVEVWKAMTEEGGKLAEPSEVVQELERLTPAPVGADSLIAKAIAEELDPVTNEGQAGTQRETMRSAIQLAEGGVVSSRIVASLLATVASDSFQQTIPPNQLVSGRIEESTTSAARWAAPHLSGQEIAKLIESAEESTWLDKTIALVLVIDLGSIAATSGYEEVECPVDADRIHDALVGQPQELIATAARWIRHFAPDPATAYRVVAGALDSSGRIDTDARRELEAYVGQLSPSDHLEFVRSEIARVPEKDARDDFLKAARFEDLDDEAAAGLIVTAFNGATNMEKRRRVIDLWALLAPSDPQARATLIREVLMPTAEAGATGLDLVVRRRDLWRDPPHGTRNLLRSLKGFAESSDQKKKITGALEDTGLIKRKRKLLGGDTFEDID